MSGISYPDGREYYPKDILISPPAGEQNLFEFLVERKDEVGVFEKVLHVFAIHSVHIRGIWGAPTKIKARRIFLSVIYCNFSHADCTAEQLESELKKISLVIGVRFSKLEEMLLDRFLFPLNMMGEQRVILFRAEPLLIIEKDLVENLGSGGATIMYNEGKAYAKAVFAQYKTSQGSEPTLDFAKEALRATGWGIFKFNEIPGGYGVTVFEAPFLEKSDYRENRFYYGMAAEILEEAHKIKLVLSTSAPDPKNRTLTFVFRKVL
jgi:hypothetical protein